MAGFQRRTTAIFACLTLVIGACVEDPGTTGTSPPAPTSTAANGDRPSPPTTAPPASPTFTLSSGVLSELNLTNIWAIYADTATVWNGLVFAGQPTHLYTLSSADSSLAPLLAASAEVPIGAAEGDVWVIDVELSEALTWSDGEPVDANDVTFTFETVRSLGLGGNLGHLWPVASEDRNGLVAVEAPDNNTVRLVWSSRPGLAEWQHGAALAPILPEHHWSSHAGSIDPLMRTSGMGAPGFGVLQPVEYQPGAEVHSVVNEMANNPFGLTEAITHIYHDQESLADDLIEGELDAWLSPLAFPRDVAGIQRKILLAEDLQTLTDPGNTLSYLAFNTRRFPGNNLAFRQAADCMIDKTFITEDILGQAVIELDSIIPQSNTEWHDSDVSSTCAGLSIQERFETSVGILKSAGWSWEREPVFDPDGDGGRGDVEPGTGLRGPRGQTIDRMRLGVPNPGYDPIRATVSLWLQVFLTDLGVPVISDPIAVETLNERIESLDWDMYVFGWTMGDLFPSHLVSLFHSRNDASHGGLNTTGYSSEQFDALADEFLTTTDETQARELAGLMQEMIARDVPIVVLFNNGQHYIYRDTIDFPLADLYDMMSGALPGVIRRS